MAVLCRQLPRMIERTRDMRPTPIMQHIRNGAYANMQRFGNLMQGLSVLSPAKNLCNVLLTKFCLWARFAAPSSLKTPSLDCITHIDLMRCAMDVHRVAAWREITVMSRIMLWWHRSFIKGFPQHSCSKSRLQTCWLPYCNCSVVIAIFCTLPGKTAVNAVFSMRANLNLFPQSLLKRQARTWIRTIFTVAPCEICLVWKERFLTKKIGTDVRNRNTASHRQPPVGWMIPRSDVQQPVGNWGSGRRPSCTTHKYITMGA